MLLISEFGAKAMQSKIKSNPLLLLSFVIVFNLSDLIIHSFRILENSHEQM